MLNIDNVDKRKHFFNILKDRSKIMYDKFNEYMKLEMCVSNYKRRSEAYTETELYEAYEDDFNIISMKRRGNYGPIEIVCHYKKSLDSYVSHQVFHDTNGFTETTKYDCEYSYGKIMISIPYIDNDIYKYFDYDAVIGYLIHPDTIEDELNTMEYQLSNKDFYIPFDPQFNIDLETDRIKQILGE